MTAFRPKNRKFSLGFTLAELLAVVGIIAVLMAVAIPSFIAVRRSLKTAELDSAARSIFIAAQNHMSNMRRRDYTVLLNESVEMESVPEDFPESLDWDSGDYRFLSQTSEAWILYCLLEP